MSEIITFIIILSVGIYVFRCLRFPRLPKVWPARRECSATTTVQCGDRSIQAHRDGDLRAAVGHLRDMGRRDERRELLGGETIPFTMLSLGYIHNPRQRRYDSPSGGHVWEKTIIQNWTTIRQFLICDQNSDAIHLIEQNVTVEVQ